MFVIDAAVVNPNEMTTFAGIAVNKFLNNGPTIFIKVPKSLPKISIRLYYL